jgi:surfeit locus 1 family protein
MKSAQKTRPMSDASGKGSSSIRFRLPGLTTLFNRRWWWTTLLVLLSVAVFARLGFWQLDRRDQRRAQNAAIVEQLAQPPISLNDDTLPSEVAGLKNHKAVAQGVYDLSRQVALTQQNWASTPGFHLITPLVLDDGVRPRNERRTAVLVDRGWLPAEQLGQEQWSQYAVEGPLTVTGYIKLSQTAGNAETVAEIQPQWYRVDVAAIGSQLPYELLPVFLHEAPPPEGNAQLPFRSELDADLSEGNHFSYVIQWFIFATIAGVGYIYYVGKRTSEEQDGGQ